DVVLKRIVNGANNRPLVVLSNVKQRAADLMGFATSWWHNRFTAVQVGLNNSDPESISANKGLFSPIMLADVMPTSRVGLFDNVCICCEGSHIEFRLNSWGNVGFGFHIGAEVGTPVIDELLLHWAPGDKDLYGSTTIRRWQGDPPRTIQIQGIASLKTITGSDVGKYQKVSVRTRSMTQCKLNGTTWRSTTPPPTLQAPRIGFVRNTKGDTIPGGLLTAQSSTQIVITGESITPATPVQGQNSTQQWGSGLSGVELKPWTEALGEVIIYFFVFRTIEEAKSVIDLFNIPDTSVYLG
ncbi:MAG: hypothetical protein LBT24_07705, partial [Tannerella sp.]|nr:hypothetical protein [Tannerella sp.]